jgi:hypothetical protein
MSRSFVDEGVDLDISNKICNAFKPNSLLKVRASFPQRRGVSPFSIALRLELLEIEFVGRLVDSSEIVFISEIAAELICRCETCVAIVSPLFEDILGIICGEGTKTSNPG